MADPPRRGVTPFLLTCVFAAGATSILFETVWFHQTSLALGSTIWASSAVLAAYMLGIALGFAGAARFGSRTRRPGHVLAAAHVALALTSVLLTYVLPLIGPSFAGTVVSESGTSSFGHALRFAIAFGLVVVPSTCMGISLPLAVRLVGDRDHRFGAKLGRLYGWEVLGAVLGAIATEHLLIGALGIYGTAALGGFIHIAIACGVMLIQLRHEQAGTVFSIRRSGSRVLARHHGLWLAAACLSGCALLSLEVVWFRSMTMFFTAQSEAFALMLAIVLAGLTAGSFTAARVAAHTAEPSTLIAPIALGGGLSTIAGYLLFVESLDLSSVPILYSELDVLEVGLPLMFPTAFASGLLFTLIGAALRGHENSDPFAVGTVGFANAVGSAAGALIGGLVLLPTLGLERCFVLLALIYGIIAVFASIEAQGSRWMEGAFGAALVLAITLFPHGSLRARYIERALFAHGYSPQEDRTFLRVGANETILYVEDQFLDEPRHYRMVTDSFSMSGTAWQARRYMKLYAYWPAAVHPALRSVLVIGFGVGSTTKALVDTRSIQEIAVVDISKAVLSMSRIVYKDRRDHPLNDPRVQTIVEDGRFYLYGTDRRFDLITGEPPPPNTEGVASLYSLEYFQLVRNRLAPGGITTYWLPIQSLSDRSALAVLRAFCGAFEDCSLWHGMGPNLMMVGTNGRETPVSVEQFTRQWSAPVASREMRALGFERPEQIGALFIGGPEYLRELTTEVEPVRDAWPKRISAAPRSTIDQLTLYSSLYDFEAARERFAESDVITRLWPPALRERSLGYFDIQAIIQQYAASADPGDHRVMEAVHRTITESNLKAPVLWLLGSGADAQRIVHDADPKEQEGPHFQFHIGLRSLAERRFEAAAAELRIAQRDPELRARAIVIRIFALCMQGRFDDAHALLDQKLDPLEDAEAYWAWIRKTFDLNESRRARPASVVSSGT